MCNISDYICIYMYVHSTTTHHAKLYWQHLVIKVWDSHCSHGRVSKSSRGWWDCLSIWMTIGRNLLMTIPWWEWLLGISFIYLSGFDVEQNYNIYIYAYTSVDLSGFDIGSKLCVDVEQVLQHLLNNLNKTMDKTLGWDMELKRRIVKKTCVNCSE
jgi:hypothetical protein